MIETQFRLVDLETGEIARGIQERNLGLTFRTDREFQPFKFPDHRRTSLVHQVLRFVGGWRGADLNDMLLFTFIDKAPNLLGFQAKALDRSEELLLPEGDQPGVRFIHNEDGISSFQVYKTAGEGDLVVDIPLDSNFGSCAVIGIGRTSFPPGNPTTPEITLKKAVIIRRRGMEHSAEILPITPTPVASF